MVMNVSQQVKAKYLFVENKDIQKDCNVCEGCKDFRCEETDNCDVIKRLGENTTTCVSETCKTNEDCKKYVGNTVLGWYEDTQIEDGDMVCDKEEEYCKARKI